MNVSSSLSGSGRRVRTIPDIAQMTNTASKIGQDLLVKILSTVPSKSLMRFNRVAKWWYALINDHSFVHKHLSKSLHDNQFTRAFLKRMLVPTEDPNDNETQSVFSVLTCANVAVDDDDGGVQKYSTLSGTEDFDVPLAMSLEIGDDQSFRVVGRCDGIICLAADLILVR
ncbi:uncharacterized protein LOC126622080 [Malus sylvestris]|uniref:uncharacterized protein LOC126622080 n=1 Tax=Malus sylvestris TaxID=3752 RepID=UPI0010AA2120|nr:uncharacterized protein LOC103409174 [Malus domestica]XP_050146690.1 uncharacterized protein LOC126622080 [Malus sylvestris]